MSGLLKDFLTASGVRASDVREAIQESRRLVQSVEKWSGLVERVAGRMGAQAKRENLAKGAAVVGLAAGFVKGKAGELLGRDRR